MTATRTVAIGPAGTPGAAGAAGAAGVGAAWKGVWSSGTTYAVGDGVYRNGLPYISNTSSNLNHDPFTDTTGTNWGRVANSIPEIATPTISAKSFGCKANGKYVTDAAISTGTAALSSASASFTSADNGKYVLVAGAGAAGADLSTTISSVSGGVATLAATAGTTVSGARAVYGTDDTAAIQSILDYLIVTVAGGRCVWEDGVYIVAGALQTTVGVGGFRCQLALRYIPLNVQTVDVELVGGRAKGYFPGYTGTVAAIQTTGAVIQSVMLGATMSGGQRPSILGTLAIGGGFNNLNLKIDGITIRAPRNPSLTGLDAENVSTLNLQNSFFDTLDPFSEPNGPPTQPTHAHACGFVMPGTSNDTMNYVRTVGVIGFYEGYRLGEHADLDNVSVASCYVGVGLKPDHHAAIVHRALIQWCPYGISYNDPATGPGTLPNACVCDFPQVDFEDETSGWAVPIAHLNDPPSGTGGFLYGTIHYHRVTARVGIDTTPWIQVGGFNARIIPDLFTARVLTVGVGSAPAFQNSWGNFSVGATQVSFYKDTDNVVHLYGQAANASSVSTTIFTLPTGYRPAHSLRFPTQKAADAYAAFQVLADGTVALTAAHSSTYVTLDGASFPAGF